VKLKNKTSGAFAEVSEELGNVLVGAGGWEEIPEPADDVEPKPVRKRVPKAL
jgi:hypothetical protein